MNTASYSFVGPEVEMLKTQLTILTHQQILLNTQLKMLTQLLEAVLIV